MDIGFANKKMISDNHKIASLKRQQFINQVISNRKQVILNRKQVNKVEGKVENKVEGKVEDKVEDKVENRVEGKVEDKVEGKVENKLKNNVIYNNLTPEQQMAWALSFM